MKWRLKDQELQKKLDEISNGDFSLKLQEKPMSTLSPNFVEVGFSREKGKIVRCFTATFRSDEIEEVPQFNPNGWNLFPDVTPPEIGTYRLEVFLDDGDKPYVQVAGFWNGKRWVADDPEGGGHYYVTDGERMRFRPWEDPNESSIS